MIPARVHRTAIKITQCVILFEISVYFLDRLIAAHLQKKFSRTIYRIQFSIAENDSLPSSFRFSTPDPSSTDSFLLSRQKVQRQTILCTSLTWNIRKCCLKYSPSDRYNYSMVLRLAHTREINNISKEFVANYKNSRFSLWYTLKRMSNIHNYGEGSAAVDSFWKLDEKVIVKKSPLRASVFFTIFGKSL